MQSTLSASQSKFPASSDSQRIDRAMMRYASGDSAAFAELFGMLEPKLRTHLRALCRCEELARELTQETFLRIHRARASFGRGRQALPWAHAIARNCYRSHARAWNSRLARASVDSEECALQAEVEHDAEARAIARETERVLAAALATLPARQIEVVCLRAQGLSLGAVALELGVSEGAVKLRSFRSARVLRRALRRSQSDGRRWRGPL